MFDVRRSSFKITPYGINATCECLQNNLALMAKGKKQELCIYLLIFVGQADNLLLM